MGATKNKVFRNNLRLLLRGYTMWFLYIIILFMFMHSRAECDGFCWLDLERAPLLAYLAKISAARMPTRANEVAATSSAPANDA